MPRPLHHALPSLLVMGPESMSLMYTCAGPLRPKNSWDGYTVPWTDVVGDQLPRALVVA